MTRREIVEDLAKRGAVEEMCKNIAHKKTLTPDLEDLSQAVYVTLLTYDEEKIVDLWESGALGYFVARIISNQYLSKTSPFFRLFRKFRSLSDELNPNTIDDPQARTGSK